MRTATVRTLAAVLVGASALHAADTQKAGYIPVPGGMSDRIAGLNRALLDGKEPFRKQLSEVLAKSRKDAHALVDEIMDNGDHEEWLDSMAKQGKTEFATQLKGKDPMHIKAALHGRLERKIADLGRQMTEIIERESVERLQVSFRQALVHLTKEESTALKASANAAGPSAPSDSPSAPSGSPAAPFGYYPGFYPGGQRAYNANMHVAYNPAAQRTLAYQQRAAYYRGQQHAAQQHAYRQGRRAYYGQQRANRFNQYLYGRRQPWYSNPAYRSYRSMGFPCGTYYRPDRVEQVVRRGLWGAAAVAATPFALVASMF